MLSLRKRLGQGKRAVERSQSCAAVGLAQNEERQPMKYLALALVVMLGACATDRPAEETKDTSSGPTVYGQVSVSVDRINAR